MELVIEEMIYSPRRGHRDRYVFIFNRGNLLIQAEGGYAKCSECDDGFLWMGHDERPGNPLREIFVNDCINCPLRLGKYLETLYDKYLDGDDDDIIRNEVHAFAAWLNMINENIPEGAVFSEYFN